MNVVLRDHTGSPLHQHNVLDWGTLSRVPQKQLTAIRVKASDVIIANDDSKDAGTGRTETNPECVSGNQKEIDGSQAQAWLQNR